MRLDDSSNLVNNTGKSSNSNKVRKLLVNEVDSNPELRSHTFDGDRFITFKELSICNKTHFLDVVQVIFV